MRALLVAASLSILLALNAYQYFGSREPVGASGSDPAAAKPATEARTPDEVKQAVLAALSRDEVRDLFQQLFDREKLVVKNRWFGVPTFQHPFDVWIQQEIIFEVAPDFIVETGTHRGGSAGLWAMLLEHTNPDGRVISIDIVDRRTEAHLSLPLVKQRVDFLLGDAADPKIVEEVARRVEGKKVLVILDDAKDPDHILAELEAYAPLVSLGSYLIVQGTHLGYRVLQWRGPAWAPGAYEGVQRFMARSDQFVIDSSRERLIATESPDGFLKRIR